MNKTWTVIITIIATAVVTAGGAYYCLNNKAEEEKAELQTQIDELENEINKLQAQLSTTESDETTSESGETAVSSELSEEETKELICSQSYPGSLYVSENDSNSGWDIDTVICRVKKVVGVFARGGNNKIVEDSGGPGFAWLAKKIDGAWESILETQDSYDCETLEKYDVPSELLDNDGTCYNYETQESIEYNN